VLYAFTTWKKTTVEQLQFEFIKYCQCCLLDVDKKAPGGMQVMPKSSLVITDQRQVNLCSASVPML